VREAISIAIDRQSLNANILGGTGAPAAWINPNTFGINPDLKPIAYDPERAKTLLAGAGYPNGFDIVLDTPQGKYLKDLELAEAVAGQLAKVGIRVKLQPLEWGVFTRRMFGHQASPLAMMSWEDPRNDPDSHNRLLLTSGSTWSQIDDPELTNLVKQIASEMDPEKRKALIFKEQDLLRTSFPTTYLVQLGGIYGTSPKLDWWQPRPDFKDWFYQNNAV
jgi:peptide/nickel transport system substrate-binding protein